jgi:glucose dehydrogenase
MKNFYTGWHWRLPAHWLRKAQRQDVSSFSEGDKRPIDKDMILLAVLLFANSTGCAIASDLAPRDVDESSIGTIEQAPDNWLSNGRTYGEQRYSPLNQINTHNVSQIGEAWEADLESPRFGIEATPLAIGGLLFTTSSYGRVFAFDSKTGIRRWSFDPESSAGLVAEWMLQAGQPRCCPVGGQSVCRHL